MEELNRIYQKETALHEDYDPDYFRWLDCHQEERCIYAIGRGAGEMMLAAVFNFSDREQEDYELEIDGSWEGKCILHTDWDCWSGETPKGKEIWEIERGKETSKITAALPPYSGMLLELTRDKKKTLKTKNKK